MNPQGLARALRVIGGLSASAGAVYFVGNECLYNVDAGERAVIFDRFRGIVPDVRV